MAITAGTDVSFSIRIDFGNGTTLIATDTSEIAFDGLPEVFALANQNSIIGPDGTSIGRFGYSLEFDNATQGYVAYNFADDDPNDEFVVSKVTISVSFADPSTNLALVNPAANPATPIPVDADGDGFSFESTSSVYSADLTFFYDTIPPTLNVPADRVVTAAEVQAALTLATANVSASDNYDPNPAISFTDVVTPGASPEEFTYTRTFTATDYTGNQSSRAFVLTVDPLPSVTSITAHGSPTDADTITFTVAMSEGIFPTSLTTSDFALFGTLAGDSTVVSVTPDATNQFYDVVVDVPDDGNGTLGLTTTTGALVREASYLRFSDIGGQVSPVVDIVNNRPPVPGADNVVIAEDSLLSAPGGVLTFNVLDNDTDPDGDLLTVVPVGPLNSPFTFPNFGLSIMLDSTGLVTVTAEDPALVDAMAASESAAVTLVYGVSDGLETVEFISTFQVFGVNDAPAVADEIVVTNETSVLGAALTGNLLDNGTDIDNAAVLSFDGLTIDGLGPVPLGTQVVLGGGFGLTVLSDGGYALEVLDTDAVRGLGAGDAYVLQGSFTVTDGIAAPVAAAFDLTVGGVNDAPTVQDETIATTETTILGASVTGNLLDNASDPDANASLSLVGFSTPGHGAFVFGQQMDVGGGFGLTVFANGDYALEAVDAAAVRALGAGDSFSLQGSFQISDGIAAPVSAAFDATVMGVNDPPEPQNDAFLATEDMVLIAALTGNAPTGNLLDNDFDAEGDALTITGLSTGAVGSLIDLGNGLGVTISGDGTYAISVTDPLALNGLTAGETAGGSLTYTVSDGIDDAQAQFTLAVTGMDDIGTARNDHLTGTNGADFIDAQKGNDKVFGLDGDDFAFLGQGNDMFYGGDGIDTAVYAGAFEDYSIDIKKKSVQVRDLAGQEGNDKLWDVEFIHFLGDGSVLDLSTGTLLT